MGAIFCKDADAKNKDLENQHKVSKAAVSYLLEKNNALESVVKSIGEIVLDSSSDAAATPPTVGVPAHIGVEEFDAALAPTTLVLADDAAKAAKLSEILVKLQEVYGQSTDTSAPATWSLIQTALADAKTTLDSVHADDSDHTELKKDLKELGLDLEPGMDNLYWNTSGNETFKAITGNENMVIKAGLGLAILYLGSKIINK